jgi:hypothetical protein
MGTTLTKLPEDLRGKVESTCPVRGGTLVWKADAHYAKLDALERLPEQFRTRVAMDKIMRYPCGGVFDPDDESDVEIPSDGYRETVLWAFLTLFLSMAVTGSVIGVVNHVPHYSMWLLSGFAFAFSASLAQGIRYVMVGKRFKRLQEMVRDAYWASGRYYGPILLSRDELDVITSVAEQPSTP